MAGMKCSFDGVRRHLSMAYNNFVEEFRNHVKRTEVMPNRELLESLNEIRYQIVSLNCMYDASDPDDCNTLDIELKDAEQYFEELEDFG